MIKKNKGFSLIEVMVALAIMAVAVTTLLVIRNNAIIEAGIAVKIRRKNMLLEQKMAEISLNVEKKNKGDFEDEGFPDYIWESESEEKDDIQLEDPITGKKYVVLYREVILRVRHQEEEEKDAQQLVAYFLLENPEDADKKTNQ